MGKKATGFAVSKLPQVDCQACGGLGAIRITAHFVSGDRDFDWPCWECFGQEVRLPLPKPDKR